MSRHHPSVRPFLAAARSPAGRSFLAQYRAALELFLGPAGLSRAFDPAGRLKPEAVALALVWRGAGVAAADCAGWVAGPEFRSGPWGSPPPAPPPCLVTLPPPAR